LAQPVYAQKEKKGFKKGGVVKLDDTVATYSQSDIFRFPNVNKLPYYYDNARLQKIKALDKPGQEAQMYAELKSYIKNFGIENFSKNTGMLWRLAKLSETQGPAGEALLLYKLVLKHHQQGLDINEIYKRHQMIDPDKKENYVPLDFYYKLVEYRKDIDTLRPPQSILVNMGGFINSDKEDYGPTAGNTDDLILFTSKRNENMDHSYNEDLFFSRKVEDYWDDAQPFKSINTKYNEGSACLSHDGKFLYFSRCEAPDGLGNCDLYMAVLKADSTWGDVKNLGPNINSAGWDSHPSLTHGGDTLYFASNRAGSFGLSDIYFAVKDKKGAWGKAQNAGPVINTIQSEVSPFFHHKFNVLYFSSNGHPLNFGEFDIYKSYRVNDAWSEPLNTGP
ncbi:MAG TPA: OmpA family protein, partial [Cyclobacteriaceae bacterium]|nr:OmpA family protein [Cyclobacteriaceae bacterium]